MWDEPFIFTLGESHITHKCTVRAKFRSCLVVARIPFTLRIDAEELTALNHLGELERRPVGQLLNEAIKIYLSQQSSKEAILEAHHPLHLSFVAQALQCGDACDRQACGLFK